MPAWEGISEFVAVVDCGSFTSAARRLDVSVAHVSRQLQALERRLDTRLLYRTTRKVSMTAEGELYYRHCRQVLSGLEEADQAIGNLKNTPRGQIKLTAPVTYGETYILPLVHEFMLLHPQVTVIAELTNQQVDLVEGGYDLAIRLGRLASSSMIAKRLASRTQHVCASPSYLDSHGTPHSLSELGRHNCLLGNHPYWRFQEEGRERTIRVHGSITSNSGNSLLDAALKSIGLVQLPNYYVAPHLGDGRLIEVLSQFREPEEGIWALYPQSRHLSPRIRMLVDFLAGRLGKH
ncbi:MAG: LysR family transcriptional regulator [Ectothiorhodospiraceae bacterium]|nr:LysR family transcriptional regulator [Ectothiorhodospiraceae bacterium]MCH8503607.1 LysR family transcriptional regulator [Ectothiorhodospiraceae bacterium]